MSKFLDKLWNTTAAIITAPADIINTLADGLAYKGHHGSRFYQQGKAEQQYEENQRQHYSREFHWHLKSERKDEALSMLAQRLDPQSKMFNFHLYDSEESAPFNGQPTLVLAAKQSMLPVMRELINVHGIRPQPQWWFKGDMQGKNALHVAVINNDIAVAQELISFGADSSSVCLHEVKTKNEGIQKKRLSVVDIALQSGNEKMIDALLVAGIDLNKPNDDGYTPLAIARALNHDVAQGILKKHGIEESLESLKGDTSLLFAAIKHGNIDEVKKRIDAGVDVNSVNSKGWTPLMVAAAGGYGKIVDILIEAKADPNIVATEFNSKVRAIDLALQPIHVTPKQFREVNYHSRRALEYDAKLSPQVEIVKSLLRAGSEEPGNMPYHPQKVLQAVRESRPEIDMRKSKYDLGYDLLKEFEGLGGGVDVERCLKLVKAGADLGVHYQYHDTPLFYAAARGYEELVTAMIEAGADVNAKNKLNETPLSSAAGAGRGSIVSKLIEAGARVDNSACVYAAAQGGHHEVVSELLKAGADINRKDGLRAEWTPLMAAAHEGHIKVAQVLLEGGADSNQRIWGGENAAAIAKRRGNDAIAGLINDSVKESLNNNSDKPSVSARMAKPKGLGL